MILVKKKNSEVFYLKKKIEFINHQHINFLKKKVKVAKRKRARICMHTNLSNKLHEMLIILTKNTYIRPHKHLGKAESLHVVEGSADVIFFNDKGKIIDRKTLGEKDNNYNFYYRINSSTFHTFKLRTKYFIFHEATEGPFLKSKTKYAKWSPQEKDFKATKKFMNSIKV
jgi:cupin fold WbuC family metalloprotein